MLTAAVKSFILIGILVKLEMKLDHFGMGRKECTISLMKRVECEKSILSTVECRKKKNQVFINTVTVQ